MANDYFKFRQFTVSQGRCAMKVGTDGTLLGAWAHGGNAILDVGTGTGLVALMMAQRYAEATVVGIDIDGAAVSQAAENAAASPFARRVAMVEADVATYGLDRHGRFTAVVSNPPYFIDALTCPDARRTQARHASSLTYSGLLAAAWRLLADDGELSVIVPFDSWQRFEGEAALAGFFKSRQCGVRTTPRKPPRRYMLAFRKHPVVPDVTEEVLETSPGVRSPWYDSLTADFYL